MFSTEEQLDLEAGARWTVNVHKVAAAGRLSQLCSGAAEMNGEGDTGPSGAGNAVGPPRQGGLPRGLGPLSGVYLFSIAGQSSPSATQDTIFNNSCCPFKDEERLGNAVTATFTADKGPITTVTTPGRQARAERLV